MRNYFFGGRKVENINYHLRIVKWFDYNAPGSHVTSLYHQFTVFVHQNQADDVGCKLYY